MRVKADEIVFTAEPEQIAVLRKLGVLDEDLVGLTYEDAEDWIYEITDELEYERKRARRARVRQPAMRRKELEPQKARELAVQK